MATPMFALQSVLLPGSPLPLHVFEPRYVAMLDTVISTDAEMGVVLIERGREVGGGDVRCDVATMARVAEARELAGGRLLVMALGVRRIRVRRWLPDDPHPCAETEDWPDEPEAESPPTGEQLRQLGALVAEARSLARRLEIAPGPQHPAAEVVPVDMGRDVSEVVPVDVGRDVSEVVPVDVGRDVSEVVPVDVGRDVSEVAPVDVGRDVSQASYRAAALAPLGPLDRYEVLCTPGAGRRLAVAHRVVADAVELLRARIELGTG